ncbi:MAG TPA: bifunctional enoyl-CoA hydratase/phosphate acetyltransferase [Rhodospirillales bacterium]|jgi:phosphotransacetylase
MLSRTPFEVPAKLAELSRKAPLRRMAIAGAGHPVPLESARQAAQAGLIEPVLIGGARDIAAHADEMGWDISGFEIIDKKSEAEACAEAARLAARGAAATLMKGHVHTDTLMRAVLDRDAGLRTDRRVSHVFHMTVPGSDKVLLISDGAVNVAPDARTMMDIVRNAVDVGHALGIAEPKVAMLSGAETENPSMPSSLLAAEIVRWAKAGKLGGAVVDGPFAFDNAISPEAARLKGIGGAVAGQADILAVPNIETGNALFKMMVHFMSGLAAGVVVGAKVPVVLTSRADPPEARLAAAMLAAVVADAKRRT